MCEEWPRWSSHFVDNDTRFVAPKGVIALQMHPGPPMKVQFKNIVLRELKAE